MIKKIRMINILVLSCLFGTGHTESHHPQEFLKSIRGAKNEGEQIYMHYCVNCHAEKPLIPLGAPRLGHEEDWKPRLQEGMKALFKNTSEGLNAMPARGGCFECTDEQLMMAVSFMIKQPEQKKPIK